MHLSVMPARVQRTLPNQQQILQPGDLPFCRNINHERLNAFQCGPAAMKSRWRLDGSRQSSRQCEILEFLLYHAFSQYILVEFYAFLQILSR